MKVSLWAEIRRLYEVERLSQAAIARRLHCSHRTVRKALAMASPPTPARGPHESVLDRYRAQIDALVAKYPDLSAVRVTEEISKGENGYRGTVYPVRRYLH
jgi:transposase